MKEIVIDSKFGWHSIPILEGERTINVKESDLKEIGKTKCFDVNKYTIVLYDNSEEAQEEKLEKLRHERKKLLVAFDIWEKNVLRGREEDSTDIMQWYQDILDLKETAFDNIPDKITKYL